MSEIPAAKSGSYNFLGYPFVLTSDSPKVLADFGRIYDRFRVASNEGAQEDVPVLRATVLTGTPDRRPVLIVDDKRIVLEGPTVPELVYFYVLNFLFQHVEHTFILHGGVVEAKGKALIISGASGAGKTTLTLAFAQKGYAFLSDELAPLHGERRIIEPFPRRIGVRTREGELKDMIDIAARPGGRLGAACPPGWIVYLAPAVLPDDEAGISYLEVACNRMDGSALQAFSMLPGVIAAEALAGRFHPSVRLKISAGAALTEAIDELCRRSGLAVLDYHHGRTLAPDFEGEPGLERLSGISGVLLVARQLLNARPPSRLLARHHGSQPALIMALADMLRDVAIYRLTPGPVDKMVALIEDYVL
ncbi:MAG TPA: hypothetical protein PKE26_07785 [Kiritimatiellia bacterium]|nr:hypothetical protein [Kiritimatiellia bacterium]HMO98992.1 hypothetical protein [Kiritimatiellia bacterium]HMP95879.1 hypothetical protein [Kiritimatiellia bacterium]